MADTPQYLTLRNHRDGSQTVELTFRRVFFTLIALFAVLALLNVFGQHSVSTAASGGGAIVEVTAPTDLRGGLFYMGRFRITAEQEIKSATIVLRPGLARVESA